jgi:MFS family permease
MNRQREHRGLVLAIILVGYRLILLDVSILMAALPTIHADLGFSAAGLSWVQNAYTLAFGGLLLLGARADLGRARHRRRVPRHSDFIGDQDACPSLPPDALPARRDRGRCHSRETVGAFMQAVGLPAFSGPEVLQLVELPQPNAAALLHRLLQRRAA